MNWCANFSNGTLCEDSIQGTSEGYKTLYAVLCSVVAIATVLGNVLLFFTVLSSSQLRNATNSLLLSLATADLVSGAVMVPLYAQQFISGDSNRSRLSQNLCLTRKFLFLLTSGASITSLAVVSVDRMFAVLRPFVYARVMRAKLVTLIIITVWTVCLTLTSCAVFIPLRSWDPYIANCRPGIPRTSYLAATPVLFYLPGVTILVCYVKIFGVARMHRRKITVQGERSCVPSVSAIQLPTLSNRKTSNVQERTSPPPAQKTSTSRVKKISRIRNTLSTDLKAAKTISILVGLFLVCWLPVASFYIYINSTGIDVVSSKKFTCMHDAFMFLSFLNATIDPLLYMFLNKDMKISLKKNLRNILKIGPR